MRKKKRELKGEVSGLLSDGDKPFVRPRRRQVPREGRRGRRTAILAVILCAGVILGAFSEAVRERVPRRLVSSVGDLLSGVAFMDLSGEASDTLPLPDENKVGSVLDGLLLPNHGTDTEGDTRESEGDSTEKGEEQTAPPLTLETLYDFCYEDVPAGETPILPMDLSLTEYGIHYINNATGYQPNTEKLLAMKLNLGISEQLALGTSDPLVLIVHTHGTEAYSEDGAISFSESGEIARSTDAKESVVAVGKVLAEALNRSGIRTLHTTVMHDEPQYKDAYIRSEETVRKYLKEYPSIRLVIDLHRDSILKSNGDLVRPVTLVDGSPSAQVMCVVGSSWNGGDYPDWERNLSLALKLRNELSGVDSRLCRPVYLKGSTYNQELAPFSLLLEVGASGNSLKEAKRAAEEIGDALAHLLTKT